MYDYKHPKIEHKKELRKPMASLDRFLLKSFSF